jgi:hypothetical protein
MGTRRIAMLLMVAASQACAQPVTTPASTAAPPQSGPTQSGPTQSAAPQSTANSPSAPLKRIFLPPPVRWDNPMLSSRPALQQTATDFGNLTGGIVFGMSPSEVNAHLPDPYPGLSWAGLASANEYPGEVRYFGAPIDRIGSLRMDPTACSGSTSYLVFLFAPNGLFRLSYRLIADKSCADTDEAAQAIFARYVTIGQSVALSVRYQTGKTAVVDVTDPGAGYLTPIRWRQGVN